MSMSRPKRWADACQRAIGAIQDLVELQGEYQEWLDNLPQNLQSSTLGEKLQTVTDLSLEDALSTIEEAEGIDLPMGFGKD